MRAALYRAGLARSTRPDPRSQSVDQRDQPPGAAPIRRVGVAEFGGEQRFLSIDPRHQHRYGNRQDEHGQGAAKDQHPAGEQEERAEVAGMANQSVPAMGEELMLFLDGDEGAEAPS